MVAVTGPSGFLGSALAARLRARGTRVVGFDLRRPDDLGEGVIFHGVDLTEPTCHARLADLFAKEGVEAVMHAALRSEPGPDLEADHELDVIGSLHVLNACAAAKVPRLVLPSTTMVYGARPDNPNFLTERHARRGHPGAHAVRDRIAMEETAEGFRTRHREVELCLLRPCWVLGPGVEGPVSRYFSLPVVPVPMGYDPLLQLLHPEDWLHACEVALVEGRPGVFNVVAPGALPLSTLLRLAGQRALPLPSMLLDRLAYLPSQARTGDPPAAFFDYLRHPWVADGAKGWAAFGEPAYTTKEAWMSFVSARRMRRYR